MGHRKIVAVAVVLALSTTTCAAPTLEIVEVTRVVPKDVEVTRLVRHDVEVTRLVRQPMEITRRVPQTVEVTCVVSQTVEVTRVISEEVEVTRIVERVVTATLPPATPVTDIAGSRDLSIIPRPSGLSCGIVKYVLEDRFVKLVYECDTGAVSPPDLVGYYLGVMPSRGWVLSESEESDGMWSLSYEVSGAAPADVKDKISSAVVRIEEDGDVALYLQSKDDMSLEDWEPFLEPR